MGIEKREEEDEKSYKKEKYKRKILERKTKVLEIQKE
jgi:hypothetical protein